MPERSPISRSPTWWLAGRMTKWKTVGFMRHFWKWWIICWKMCGCWSQKEQSDSLFREEFQNSEWHDWHYWISDFSVTVSLCAGASLRSASDCSLLFESMNLRLPSITDKTEFSLHLPWKEVRIFFKIRLIIWNFRDIVLKFFPVAFSLDFTREHKFSCRYSATPTFAWHFTSEFQTHSYSQ